VYQCLAPRFSSAKLKELTQRIYHYTFFRITKKPSELNAEQLEIWIANALKEIETKTEDEFAKPVDELVKYLEDEIDKNR
jgi:hypothetical protein